MTTTGDFFYLDPASISPTAKPFSKVDGGGTSYAFTRRRRSVTSFRDCLSVNPSSQRGSFGTDIDVAGFAAYHAPARERLFADDAAIRQGYYAEVEALLRSKLGPGVARVVIFDHTIRRHDPAAPRQPVRQVHVDQTPRAAEARVRRHAVNVKAGSDGEEEEYASLVGRRYQIVNVWRPIGHAAQDFPLALVDWRTTSEERDLVKVDLLYPMRNGDGENDDDDDDRGKEAPPDPNQRYEVKGETYGVVPSDRHKFYYVKDMTPDEVMLIKCFDSWGEGRPGGKKGVAGYTPHTAFVDPAAPEGAKPRESIEVRCLVFYDE
ncbi:uncharacterized protein B0T15DRAFT_515561 [Chaetomium strumarium]|uniref:Uncharacterized protein n=1 Tax=Chaetomium strumarium TaxID=1170767 RepID=A0AAJ0H0A1_9PEZI|nr:hypothetical protein B0T15DRAFT_515561 [Chaetomium strumarium]